MRWSIRYQLLIPPLILLVGVIGMSVWAALASVERAHRQIEAQVRDIVQTANRASYELTDNVLKLIKGYSGVDFVRTDGEHYWKTFETVPTGLPPAAEGSDPPSLANGPRVTIEGTTYLCTSARLQSRQNAGTTLYVFYPETLWRDALWEAVWPPVILGTFAALASILLTLVVGRRLSRRVQELERRTRQIAAGDFSPIPLPHGNDEVRDLGQSVNDMAQQLAQYQDTAQKTERLRLLGQVSGGLAHQLRNGVTGARLAVQVHARECNGQTDAEPLNVALRQLALVETHLKRFLDLGHADEMRREACALANVLGEAVALMQPQCRHAHIDLRWQPPEAPATVHGDAGQLGHLFGNVLSNAVEAAGPGGTVEVRLRSAEREARSAERGSAERAERGAQSAESAESGRPLFSALCASRSALRAPRCALIDVWDSGPGPAPEVAARLFEPFVTGRPDGVGLGLAVARQVAEAHGGSITWRREGQQTCFRIELPLAA